MTSEELKTTRNLGVVKWFDTQKGYGFLSNCLNDSDIFVHFSDIQVIQGEYKILYTGEYVSYSDGNLNGKMVAKNVTGVCGGNLRIQSEIKNKKRKQKILHKTDVDDHAEHEETLPDPMS
jgi:CspA family cold shock protein